MKFHLISETIDGSIKDIVQLKTLDSSLEYSQMFDALEDCPKDFQAKLIQALNSVGETIQASPVDVFNIVLCASNEEDDKDATKKMYNWWKAVFEILSKCEIPDDRKAEYDDLVDTLMAEVSKAGDDAQVNEAEEYGYEQANIEDEEVMLKDMEFAISKIGEIANRVQDLINFVNPYCQSVNEDNMMKFKKINESDDHSNSVWIDGKWVDYNISYEVVEVTYYLPEDYKDNPHDDSWITRKSRLFEVCGTYFDGKYEMVKKEGEPVYRTSAPDGYNYFKFDNPEDDAKFLEWAEMLRDGNQINERSGYYSCVDDDIDEVPIGLDDDYFYRSSDRDYEHDYDNDDDNMSPEEKKQARQGLRESIDDTWEYMGEEFPIEVKKLHRDYVCGVVDNSIASDIKGELNKLGVDDARTLAKWFIQDRSEFEDIVAEAEEAEDWNILIDYMIDNELSDSRQDAQEYVWEYFDIDNDGGDKYPTYEATDGEWVDMDDLIGVPQTDPADDASLKTEGFSDFNDDGEDPIISYEDEDGNHSVMVVTGHDEMGETVYQVKIDEEEWTTTSNFEEAKMEAEKLVGKINKRPDADYQLMPVEVMESDVKEVEGFKVGDKVIWDDPDGEPTDGWTIVDFEFEYPDDDEFDSSIADEVIVDIEKEDGSYAQALLIELEHDGEVDDGNPWSGLPGSEDIEAMDLGLVDAKDILPKRLQKADEAKVVQDVTDVWALLKVLEDDEASKNLKELIDSHVRSEEEIMDAIDELYPEDVTQTELNNVFASGMEDIVDALGLDVNAYVKDGSFVDLDAPSTIAAEGDAEAKPEEVNGDEKKFKGDDGEVKTLDNANKKVVSEMTIEQDINSAEQLERILWGQGKENFIELVSKYGADEVMSVLEDSGITNLTQMNDYLWFEIDSIEEMLGGSPDDEDEEF